MTGIEVHATVTGRQREILSDEALGFIADLQREFAPTRDRLLAARRERQATLDRDGTLDFLPATRRIRESDWRVSPVPDDLQVRKVEITGPTDRKMVINALNSGASVFMADFEDANTPTWVNMVDGHVNLGDAITRTIEFTNPDGREYRLNDRIATLVVRPRGWHLPEKHIEVDGRPLVGAFMDFGLYFFHNAKRLIERGSGPYFYLPKTESQLEARLWNDIFNWSQDRLGIPRGTVKATVLIEVITAAFEMDEILYELRDHSGGLNAGRWDYIFSLIKKFSSRSEMCLPDRAQVTMTVPFMRAYTELLIRTCHRRGAFALGGMAAFIPTRKDPKVNETALARVREDKVREANDGMDGTWVAHPDLVPTAMEEFDRVLGTRRNQLERTREEVRVAAKEMLDVRVPGATVTDAGVRANVSVAIQYIESWLRGTGAAAINNLMEDAATAEISRSQIWQWIRHGAKTAEGTTVTPDSIRKIEDEELAQLSETYGDTFADMKFAEARELFEEVALGDEFVEFLTLPGYLRLP
ncbi:MAG: malate synthase A [Candidatus Limnocylindria bacterium]